MILFGIKSVLIQKNLIASLSIIKKILKTSIKSHGDEVSDFYDKFLRGEDRSGKCDLN